MKPYFIQSFKNDLGETVSARLIAAKNNSERISEVTGTEVTIHPEDCTRYICGELEALTLSDYPEHGAFLVVFTSGSTATTLTVPTGLVMPDNFTVEANTRYEINVRDGYALCAGWTVNVL